MYQVQKLGSHFLGFVMTDAAVGETGYKSYGKYGKKYGYGYGYGYDYATAAPSKSEKAESKRQAFLDAATEESFPAEPAEEKTEKTE